MTARVHVLSNGVRVLCDPMPGLETLALSLVVRGGARWESPEQSGWSHLLEHMVFKGAGERSARDIVETIEAVGANINAATGYERTSFQVRALKGGLELGLSVVADLVLRPTLNADDLEKEKDVVGQEIAEAFDTPDDHVFELAQTQAFAGQALGRPILGEVETVGAATRGSLDAWRRTLYAPDRLAISVAGAVDEDELLALSEKLFGAEKAEAPAADPEPGRFTGGSAVLARRIEQANLVWQLPAPDAYSDDWYAARLAAEILGGGMASRLFQEAREKRGLAYSIDAWVESFEDVGVLGVYAGAQPGKATALARLVAEQIEGLTDGPTQAELDRGKAQLQAALFMAEESPLSRAERAAGQAFLFGRTLTTQEVREGVEAVTIEKIGAVMQASLAPRLSAASVLGPKSAAGAPKAFHEALFGKG
jgi:predicted Zn-dependent peptidase